MLTRRTLIALLLLAAIARAQPIALPRGEPLDSVDFERHVAPLLSRFGCNAGACHGSFQGRGGMRFSLFGHDAQMDYEALLDRIDTNDPADSYALLKPTAEQAHEGGKRFARGSWAYQVIARWVSEGGEPSSSPVEQVRLEVHPKSIRFAATESRRLTVTASINAEAPIDVTSFCRFSSGDEGIVTVDKNGTVKSVRPGATHLIIEYLGNLTTVLTSAPLERISTSDTPEPTASNFVDHHINVKLRELNLDASPPASDEVFLRRVTLDTLARLPTLAEMGAFRADKSPDRDRKLIERLLCDERHASLWATRLCDMTRCTVDELEGEEAEKPKRVKMWHDWFQRRIWANVPYDQIVRGVLCGTSLGDEDYRQWLLREANLVRTARSSFHGNDYADYDFLDLYWRRRGVEGQYPRRELAETTSAAFLGIQIECAQCHKHPYDHWTQEEYGGFVNIFSQVQFGSSSELNKAFLEHMDERRQGKPEERPPSIPKLAEVFNDAMLARPLAGTKTSDVLPPGPLGGEPFASGKDPREQLMDWFLTDGREPFARNFANRVWAQYFGRGIVEPVDHFSAVNPPTHPELLDHLASSFINSGYDIRQLEMNILLSAAYRRSSEFVGNNRLDRRHYARAYVRPLMAEATIDSMHQALGVSLVAANDLPPGASAIDYGGDRMFGNTAVARMFRTFGREPRKSTCDCDRRQEPSLRQSLFQMSDPWVLESIRAGGLLADASAMADIDESIRHVFASVLARRPTPVERQAARAHLSEAEEKSEAWTDLIWALVNTREFTTNR